MRTAWLLLAGLAACGSAETPSPTLPQQALVFTAPQGDDHPAYRVQMLVREDQVEALEPGVLFPRFATALHPALAACSVDAAQAGEFLLEGELRVDSLAGTTLHSAAASGSARCVVDTLAEAPLELGADVDARIPFALVLIEA